MADGTYHNLTDNLALADEDTLVVYDDEGTALCRIEFNIPTDKRDLKRIGHSVLVILGLRRTGFALNGECVDCDEANGLCPPHEVLANEG